MIKNFSRNTNYINICKTICEKYVAKVNLENFGAFDNQIHPILADKDVEVIYNKFNEITAILYHGILIKNKNNTYLMCRQTKEIFRIIDICETELGVFFKGNKLINAEFHNELIAYKISNHSAEIYSLSLRNISPYIGHEYLFDNQKFIYFNRVCL